MRITFNGKTLWHVQSVTEWHEDPYDMFIISENEPTDDQIRDMYLDENEGLELDDQEVIDFIENCNKYYVYAEEV